MWWNSAMVPFSKCQCRRFKVLLIITLVNSKNALKLTIMSSNLACRQHNIWTNSVQFLTPCYEFPTRGPTIPARCSSSWGYSLAHNIGFRETWAISSGRQFRTSSIPATQTGRIIWFWAGHDKISITPWRNVSVLTKMHNLSIMTHFRATHTDVPSFDVTLHNFPWVYLPVTSPDQA